MKLKEICRTLEQWAPLSYQESYDNSGLLVGNPEMEVNGALVALDVTEEVLQEAIDKKCNLIIAHHPLVFSGMKRFTGANWVERCLIFAIKNDLAIYAIHTNLDNVHTGVNAKIAEKLGLKNTRTLMPKKGQLTKLVVYCPKSHAEKVRTAMFDAGAGTIGNYEACSFNSEGLGTFRANEEANPHVGERGKLHAEPEFRIEVVLPQAIQGKVVKAMIEAHPYEEVAYDCYELQNSFERLGAGMIGELEAAIPLMDFLNQLKNRLNAKGIRYTSAHTTEVRKIAVCGGSGSFTLPAAIAAGADVLVTADFKYHQFFDADGQITIADVGHYETEQFTSELIRDYLHEKFPTFALILTEVNTNPINYL